MAVNVGLGVCVRLCLCQSRAEAENLFIVLQRRLQRRKLFDRVFKLIVDPRAFFVRDPCQNGLHLRQ